ncbi:MAG: DUF6279 family lipoprotein [Pseudomonadota bacterium]|nr:DUF6279 family lipoprotein [Pseudomonadota bacterium]
MTFRFPNRIAVFGLVLTLLFLPGCSRVSIFYNTADFFIEQYAEDYLGLQSAQIASWRPTLDDGLARHRREELPYLAAFFDNLHRDAQQGFDEESVRCLLDEFEDLYRRHFRIVVDVASPLLAGLTPEQVGALDRKFQEDNEDEPDEDDASVERRDRKRAERYTESAEWWIGPLTVPQAAIIRDVTAAMPDTAAGWVAYRSAKQDMLVLLLEQRADEARIHRFLTDWLVEHNDLPPRLREARVEIRRRVVELFVRMGASFTPKQRARFAARLAGLRDDFMALQHKPRMAAMKCSGVQ